MKKGKDGFYNRYIKRILDFLFALILSIPSIPLIIVCALLIKFESDGPAFFVQERPGLNGKIFRIYKLRTMIVQTEKDGIPLSHKDRITRSGKFIRACSIDELPQIWNVLKGEMSFIGPRPLLEKYLSLYTEEQSRRHDVRPGISGWAQVNGRNEISWEQKFERDVWYVDHVSFILDIKILFMTVNNVLHHKGIDSGVGETMKAFTGSAKPEI